MKTNYLLTLLVIWLLPIIGTAQTLNCNLTYLTTIQNFDVYQHDSSGAILYRAKMSIDADGSPNAYGPNNTGLDWTANAGSTGNWWGVVTDVNGDPIIQSGSDPSPGMYVSSTSLVQSGYADSNPLRYVDSETIPYIALPSSLQSLASIAKGDLAYVRNITNGNTSYAYFADTGPSGKLGEGSMMLATNLGINNSPKTGGTSQAIIDYMVFPQSGFGQGTHLTASEIDSIGLIYLTAAGGLNLPSCLDSVMPSLNCSSAVPLTDGVSYSGASSSSASIISTYGCNNWTETGPERVHSITPCGNGSITATLSNFSGDLDVYILGSCNPFDCLGSVSSSSATYSNAIAGQKYYIVVDADDGSGSGYDLVVDLSVTGGGAPGIDTQTACDSYVWIDGNTYTASDTTTTYTLVGGSVSGCDSVVTLNLTVTNSSTGTDTQSACDSYTWIDGVTYTSSNSTAAHTLTGANAIGCDSVVTLNLTITNSTTGTDTQSACDTYTWIDGLTYTTSNTTATHTLVGGNAVGCDSVVTLDLTIYNSSTGTDTQTACNNYTWIDGNTYASNNTTATHTLSGGNAVGCDSVITLNLTINTGSSGMDTQTACDTYTWIDGNTYASNNTAATHTLVNGNAQGCDSVITLDLIIVNSSGSVDTKAACDTYTWIDGLTYTSDNTTATHTFSGGNAVGCDSVVTLNLMVGSVSTAIIQTSDALIASQGGATYQWLDCGNGNIPLVGEINQSYTVAENGTYAVVITSGSCSDTSACTTMNITGLGEGVSGNTFSIYPNPTKDQFSISFSTPNESHTVEIRNSLGQVVLEFLATEDQVTVAMSPFPKGVYVVSAASSEGIETVKVVKQ